ncbi:type I-C CRISPR-associated protein Cas8c/Csd1 [Sphingosinithalassobacter sp. LHW66-3]|uniref:type I-C CRISPR-associated protein Cas8c/Csd1 n=1 Tax=Sphingosinithalassobacter sp. LHW66-3 TaxID=3424718 RepID=UPI003D6B3FE6
MTILQALNGYYERLPGVAAQGWSSEKFGWCIVLNADGDAVDVENLHDLSGKKAQPKFEIVPASFPRPGTTPRAFFLWDKTAFALGVTKSAEGTGWAIAERQHAAFVALHLERLAGQEDVGLVALRRFVEKWRPKDFDDLPRGTPDMLDANILFRLAGERGYLHERPAARALVEAGAVTDDGAGSFCLVTGEAGPIARLHPTIKGVEGAQPSGAALVSFNLDAFTSLGKEQGANAPTSEAAAFRYGAALNQLLRRDSRNRLPRPIGDATVVFWADASDVGGASTADAAEAAFAAWLPDAVGDITDEKEAALVRTEIEKVAAGRPVAELRADLDPGTRFHILGLSPNAARISVRFWLSGDFGGFVKALGDHYRDMRIQPLPRSWGAAPSIRRLLAETVAARGDAKNIPSVLAGDSMRAVLSGGLYPQSLLATVLMRLRAGEPRTADGRPAEIGWQAAVIRGVLERNARLNGKDGAPMALDKGSTNEAYRLGRLFAALEYVQERAIEGIKASIRTRFLASASAAPASVFPTLLRLSQHHINTLSSLASSGAATFHDKQIQEIIDGIPGEFPRSLKLADQGRFYIGYYHQRAERFRKRDADDASATKEENHGE